MFRFTTVAFLAATIINVAIAEKTLCFDYSDVLPMELLQDNCRVSAFNRVIKRAFNQKKKEYPHKKCKGGPNNEKMAFTGTTSVEAADQAIVDMCADALAKATREATMEGWTTITRRGVDLEEFYQGFGFLNNETGNFQQDKKEFLDREGYERWLKISDDPRHNDHYPTTEESYQAGMAVKDFFENDSKTKILPAPTDNFEAGCASNTAMCCWIRDRQYFDKNGGCQPCDCAEEHPGDNTDLCWTEQNGEVFPYPEHSIEGDLHCHGISWADDNFGYDINTVARWNSLFYVSMYDHMYKRGYVGSITNDPNIAGVQPMCGCIEDMAPVARADCNQVVGKTRYMLSLKKKKFKIEPIAGSFELDFESCRGYEYIEDFGPEEYANPLEREELKSSDNDLAAFVFKQYLEGKIDAGHVEAVEETLIGYRNPDVNDSDGKREEACKKAFQKRFPDQKYKKRELPDDGSDNVFARN